MSGLLSKFKKGGGGFLNQVDGVIAGFTFTTEPEFGGNASGGAPKGDGTPLWVALTAQVDGAEKPETTHLFAGYNADDFVISEDGSSLTPAVDGASLWGGTAFAQFYESAVTNGLTDVEPTEDGTMNFGGLIGARVRFVQVKDEGAMKRAAKNFRTSKGKVNEQGQKKGKDGKFYDIRTLQVEKVYSEGNAVGPQSAKKTTAKPAAKPAPAGKKPVAKSAPAEDVTDAATIALTEILAKNADGLPKTKLNLAVTRHLVAHPQREAIRTFLADDANLDTLAEAGVITYDDGVLAAA
jgi:hypothetical protein